LVTSGGNITRWLDVSRNVNGPVDPWSVSTRRSDPYDSTADTYLAAFDSLESAFLHARVYQNAAKDLRSALEIKIVGDSYIFSEASITQPSNTKVVGAATHGSSISREVISYRDDVAGCWLLDSGCTVSKVDLKFDVSVTASTFFGVSGASANVSNIDINGCSFTAVSGTYFINFNAVATSLAFINITDNSFLSIYEGLIYNPTASAASFSSIRINSNTLFGGTANDNRNMIDLRLGALATDIQCNDNYLSFSSTTGDNSILIRTGTVCNETEIKGNYIVTAPPATVTYTITGIYVEGFTQVHNNIIQGDGGSGVLETLNTVIAIYIGASAEGIVVDSNYLWHTGIGVKVMSIANNVVSNNIIIDFYNRGISAVDTGGDTALYGLEITNNYITGDRDAATTYAFDNYLRAIEIDISLNVGTEPVSDIIVSNNVIPNMTSPCATSAGLYGVYFRILGVGAGASSPVKNIKVDGNVLNNLTSHITQNVNNIFISFNFDLILSTDYTDERIDNISICGNLISCSDTVDAVYIRGIYAFMTYTPNPLNVSNLKVSNNTISLLTLDPDVNTVGIEVGPAGAPVNDTVISGNSVSVNNVGIFGYTRYSLISENRVFSKSTGIYVYGFSVLISNNDLICQTDRSSYPYRVACIYARQSGDQGIDILNNTTEIRGNGITDILKINVAYKGANIYIGEDAKNFTISGNITRQYYASIDGGSPVAHIYVGEDHQAFWSIDNNQIFNVNVKGAGTVSDSDGLYVDTSIVAGERGVIANNCIFGSNSTLVGTHTELAVSATAGIVTLNNNRIVINYTGPGIETATIALVGSVTMETITTNIVDKYNAGGVYAGLAF
jgi:hypothetical protein